jgi:hypothetical protein
MRKTDKSEQADHISFLFSVQFVEIVMALAFYAQSFEKHSLTYS